MGARDDFTKEEISDLNRFMVEDITNSILEEQFDEEFTEEEITNCVNNYFEDIGELMFAGFEFNSLGWSIKHHFGEKMYQRLNDACPEPPEQYDATNGEFWLDDDSEDSTFEQVKQHREEETAKANRYADFWTELLDWDYICDNVMDKVHDEWGHRIRIKGTGELA